MDGELSSIQIFAQSFLSERAYVQRWPALQGQLPFCANWLRLQLVLDEGGYDNRIACGEEFSF